MWKRAFYYAVACGRKVGIFRSWADAGPQVTGFPNNWHQKFTTKEEAREYLEGHRSVDVEMPRVPSFYAVAQGREVGIYRNWHQAEKQVSSYPNARYKKFSNERDALDFIERFRVKPAIFKPSNKKTVDVEIQSTDNHNEESSSMALDIQTPAAAVQVQQIIRDGHNSYGREDGSPVVYTDGACSKNGHRGAKAGIGVFWGDAHPDNVADPIPGRPTNNRAEYLAAIIAMETAQKRGFRSLVIRTDSALLINSITKWLRGWKKNGWKTMRGAPVENQDLLLRIDGLMQKMRVEFEKVQGHSDDYGNCKADELARQGADKYTG